jgi:hypothetical protein
VCEYCVDDNEVLVCWAVEFGSSYVYIEGSTSLPSSLIVSLFLKLAAYLHLFPYFSFFYFITSTDHLGGSVEVYIRYIREVYMAAADGAHSSFFGFVLSKCYRALVSFCLVPGSGTPYIGRNIP